MDKVEQRAEEAYWTIMIPAFDALYKSLEQASAAYKKAKLEADKKGGK